MTESEPHAWSGTSPAARTATSVLAALAAGAALGELPAWLLPIGALPLFLGGFAAPVIRVVAPGSADAHKLAVFALCLSPPAGLALFLLVRWLAFPGPADLGRALAALLAIGALLPWCAPSRPIRWRRVSRAQVLVAVLGFALAGLVAWLTLRGSAVRASHHGLLHAGLALATERGVPPTNPWMAGEPLGYYWSWHALGALVARCLLVPHTVAFALLSVWALLGTTLALGLASATLLRSGKGELLAVLLAVFGLNAIGGWRWLASGVPFEPPRDPGAVLATLRGGLVLGDPAQPWFDPRLAFGLSKFANMSSYPASLALFALGWAAASHALRHGRATWCLLCGAAFGASALLNPLVGLAGVLGTCVAALLVPGRSRVRFDVPLCLGLFALPGLWLAAVAGRAYGGSAARLVLDGQRLYGTLLPLAPLLALAFAGGLRLRDHERLHVQRALLLATATLALVLVGCAAFVALPYANEYKFVRLAALPLGVLAARGVLLGFSRGGALRAGALALLGLVAVGSAANTWLGLRAYASLAQVDLPLTERAEGLGPVPAEQGAWASDGATRAAAYGFLSSDPRVREANPVLLTRTVGGLQPRYAAPRVRGEPPLADGSYGFSGASNLQAHEAPTFAALDAFVDRPSQVLAGAGREYEERVAFVGQVFGAGDWGQGLFARLEALGRPVIVLAGELERSQRTDLPRRLEQFGFRLVWQEGGALLYAWPAEFAERFDALERR